MKFIGADGCRYGWTIAVSNAIGTNLEIQLHDSIQSIFDTHSDVTCLAIDMIIGIPEKALKGGRLADSEARRILGKRGSSVFSAPCRSAVYASDYQTALLNSRRSDPAGIGLSKQSWNLCPKIREIDQFLQQRPDLKQIIFEVHPELAFYTMNGSDVLIPKKRSSEGLAIRKDLLINAGMSPEIVNPSNDDALDAIACLWSAKRITEGLSNQVPNHNPIDKMGFEMVIHW